MRPGPDPCNTVARLSTARGAPRGAPGRDRGVGDPDREAPTLAQSGIVLRPIRDPVPLLRNMMAAIGIHLERHGWHPGSGRGSPSYLSRVQAPTDRSLQQSANVPILKFLCTLGLDVEGAAAEPSDRCED